MTFRFAIRDNDQAALYSIRIGRFQRMFYDLDQVRGNRVMNHSLLACSDGQAANYMWLEPGTLAQVLCSPVHTMALPRSRARAA